MCTLTFFDKFGVFLCVTMVIAAALNRLFLGTARAVWPRRASAVGPGAAAPLASPLELMYYNSTVAIVLLFVAFSGGFELVPGDASTA